MFKTIAELISLAEAAGTPLHTIVMRHEMEQNNTTEEALRAKMHKRLTVMRHSIQEGLEKPVQSISGFSGGNAHRFNQWLENNPPLTGPLLSKAIARALAVSEVNAGMGCIVATPTAGSAGVLPAVLFTLQEARGLSDTTLVNALFTAGGIGMVIVQHAAVSGAQGGCQAEIGSATAMAAAAAVEALGGTPRQAGQALAMALKALLGLVCDPVAGLVEVPCIKRNAAGVAQAFVAVDLALAGVESAIPPDEVIDAMAQIGRRMDERFKETAEGGLAATPTARLLARRVWGDAH